MSKGVVLQSVDSVRRDLEWRIYMAYKLSLAGYTSVISSKEEIRRIHSGSRGCIFLGRLDSNSGRLEVDRKYLRDMKKRGTSLFFMHDEGALFFTGEYEESVRRIYPEEYFSLSVMKKVFFWGEEQKQYFKEELYQDKLAVTGFPRFDLYQPVYAAMDDIEVARLQEKYGEFVLVCGRFAAVNTVPDDPSYLSKRLFDIRVEGGSLEHRSRNDILVSMFESWEKSAKEFAAFLPAVAKLAMAYPDLNFVVRPHPAERESLYREALAHFGNVYINKSGDVRPFIRASKLVVHSECTTGIEAEIAKVPNVNFRPCNGDANYEAYTVSGVNEVGKVASSYQELESTVRGVVSNGFAFEESDLGATGYIYNVNPAVNAADLIVEAIDKENHFAEFSSRLLTVEGAGAFLVSSLVLKTKNALKFLLGFLGHPRFKHRGYAKGDLKNSGFKAADVARVWNSLGGKSSDLVVGPHVIKVLGQERNM